MSESVGSIPQNSSFLALTPSEKEMICALDLKDVASAQKFKVNLSVDLYDIFSDGKYIDEDYYLKDKLKAYKYGHIASIVELEEDTLWKTQTVYIASRTFHDIRLLLVRILRVLDAFSVTIFNCTSRVLAGLGITYLARFLFDLGIVLKHGFFPQNDIEEEMGFSKRCRLAFERDGRKFRMRNDLIWFVINSASFVLSFFTGGITKLVSSVAGIAGVGFDTWNENNEFSEIRKQESLLNKISKHVLEIHNDLRILKNKIELKEQELEKYICCFPEKKSNIHFASYRKNQEKVNDIRSELITLKNSYASCLSENTKYSYIHSQLNNKVSRDRVMRRYIVIASAILFLSMTAFFLWPAHLAGIAIIASIALASGSLGNGLGRRVYQKIRSCSACKETTAVEGANAQVHPIVFTSTMDMYKCQKVQAKKEMPASVKPVPTRFKPLFLPQHASTQRQVIVTANDNKINFTQLTM